MTEVTPSKVRQQALRERAQLNDALAALDNNITRLHSDGEPAVADALASAAQVLTELFDLTQREREVVLPTLRAADAWGEQRANDVADEHASWCAALDRLRQEHSRTLKPGVLAADLSDFVRELRAGMARQRDAALSPDVLRDDVVETDPD